MLPYKNDRKQFTNKLFMSQSPQIDNKNKLSEIAYLQTSLVLMILKDIERTPMFKSLKLKLVYVSVSINKHKTAIKYGY